MTNVPQAGNTAEIDTRLVLALARLDRRLTEQDVEMVRDRIARHMTNVRLLRTVALGNGDEPAPGFDPSPAPAVDEEPRA